MQEIGLETREVFNESHQQFRATVRRFFRNDIEPYYRDWEKQRTFPADTFRKAAASMGYANNSPISSFWTNARVHRILLGTSEIRRVLIGKSLS